MSVLSIEELSSTSYKWLKSLGIKINKKYLIEELTMHQDYPAISSLADFLDMGNMDYVVAEADETYIEKFKYPLLAHIKENNKEGLVAVNNSTMWVQQPQLLDAWTGVIVMPGNNVKWETKESVQLSKDSFSKTLTKASTIMVLLISTFFITFYAPLWQEKLFIILSFLGVLLTWVTFETELGIQNQYVKQVCDSVSPRGGCNAVLKSKQAKTFFNISIADTGLTWFISQYLLLAVVYLIPQFSFLKATLFLFSIVGIGVAGWSIYAQKFMIKQWCALCLGIATLVFIQALLSLLSLNFFFSFRGSLIMTGTFIIVYIIAILPIKSVINKNRKFTLLHSQLKRWKNDVSIFFALWQQQEKADTRIWENELINGNNRAPLLLTIACNPYCIPCAKAHKTIERWIEQYPGKIAVSVRFAINLDNEADPKMIAAKLILQQSLETHNKAKLVEDWYDWMDMDRWKNKYPSEESAGATDLLYRHSEWAKQADIRFTPTLFINGRQMPVQYSLNDIESLLPQLIGFFEAAR